MGAILKSKASANAQHWALKQQSRRSWIKPTALPYTQGVAWAHGIDGCRTDIHGAVLHRSGQSEVYAPHSRA